VKVLDVTTVPDLTPFVIFSAVNLFESALDRTLGKIGETAHRTSDNRPAIPCTEVHGFDRATEQTVYPFPWKCCPVHQGEFPGL